MGKKTTNYEELISYFTRAYQHNKEVIPKNIAQDFVKSWVDDIRKKDGKEDSIYDEMLSKVDLSLKDLGIVSKTTNGGNIVEENNILTVEENTVIPSEKEPANETSKMEDVEKVVTEVKSKEDEKSVDVGPTMNSISDSSGKKDLDESLREKEEELNQYLEEHIFNDSKIKEEYEELLDRLGSDLENPNDVLIQTWVNNYKEFISKNDLDNDVMLDNMEHLFVYHFKNEKWFDFAKSVYTNEKTIKKEEIKNNDVPSLDDFEVKTELDNNGTSDASTETKSTENLEGDNKDVMPTGKVDSVVTPENVQAVKEEDVIPSVSDGNKKSEEKQKDLNIIPKDALRIVSLEKPVERSLLRNVTRGYVSALTLSCLGGIIGFGTTGLGVVIGAVAIPVILNIVRNKTYSGRLNNILEENNLVAKMNGDKFVLYDKNSGKYVNEEQISAEKYKELKKELVKIGAMDVSLFERFEKIPVLSTLLKKVKDIYSGTKEMFIDDMEYRNVHINMEQAKEKAASSEEYYKYANASIKKVDGKYQMVDEYDNVIETASKVGKIDENVVEEVESKGRSK